MLATVLVPTTRFGLAISTPRKTRGGPIQRIGRYDEAGGDDSAGVLPARRDRVKGGGGAEVDHDGPLRPTRIGGHRVHYAIRAQIARVLVEDGHPGLHTWPNDQGCDAEVAHKQPFHGRGGGRDDGRYNGLRDLPHGQALQFKQPRQDCCVLICRAFDSGFHAPVETQGFSLEQAEGRMSVSNVNREQHGGWMIVSVSARQCMSERTLWDAAFPAGRGAA